VERYEDTTAKDGVVYRYETSVSAPAGVPAASAAPGGATNVSVSPVGPSASEPAAPSAPAGATSTAAAPAARSGAPVVSDPVASRDNWFRTERTNSFIASILFLLILLVSITMAKSGKEIFIRRIAGLNAIDEAIGRATEIGKKVFYIPGIQSMDE